jgi:PTH1 family peptidyl-tRNA hydrolase
MRLVVGLGNPGKEFVGTRHNVGWEMLEELASRLGWIAKPNDFDAAAKNKFDGLVLDGTVSLHSGGSEKLVLLKPLTYMNLSGRAVAAAAGFFQIAPNDVLVLLDDIALPAGKLRLRAGGSSGGHNGLKDIERALATDQYPRLRLGVDAPPPRIPGADYVLGKFTDEQRRLVNPAVQRAANAVLAWIENGIAAAMNEFNAEES